jgi:hypothetical protein
MRKRTDPQAANTPIQPTPLRGPKIVGILQSAFVLTDVPIYRCGAADGQGVSPPLANSVVE